MTTVTRQPPWTADEVAASAPPGDRELDIRRDHCPVTFAKTSVFLEGQPEGAVCDVLLADDEAFVEVPHALREAGHTVLRAAPDPALADPDPTDPAPADPALGERTPAARGGGAIPWRVRVRKGG